MDTGFSKREDLRIKRKRYSAEFRKEAAKMIIIEGTPVREVSEQLGVPEGVLYNWKAKHVQELGGSTGEEGARSAQSMVEELTALRKELAKQRRMNEILKKTVGFFSNPE
jgi:transposase